MVILIVTWTLRFFTIFILILFSVLLARRRTRRWSWAILLIILMGFLFLSKGLIPVKGAGRSNWNPHSFWAYPWGSSVTHKGIDIFEAKGTQVQSSVPGIVIYTARGGKGGNAVLALGPKWRFHYYAHLDEIRTHSLALLKRGTALGTVGNTGNAAGKAPHLHYSVISPFPYWWLYGYGEIQGWKKMFYLDPESTFRANSRDE